MRYLLPALGLTLLVLGFSAAVTNFRFSRRASKEPTWWRMAYRWRWFAVVAFAAASWFCTYKVAGDGGESYRLLGFPFVAAAFDSSGADYVNSFTPILLFVDMLIWALFPDVCLLLWRAYITRRTIGAGA